MKNSNLLEQVKKYAETSNLFPRGQHYSAMITDDLCAKSGSLEYNFKIEKCGKHYLISAGCQKTVVHNYGELRKWIIELMDKEIKTWFEAKKK